MAGSRQRPDAFLKRSRTNRIGLLGGSFNPAHGGHRRISLFAMEALMLGEVWWLVSPGNPLKQREGMASLASRLASAKIQTRRAPIRPTAIERNLGTRYTVDTLRALKRRYPRRDFVWLMGSDNLAQFHRWRQWRLIARTMPIAVIARPGYNVAAMRSPAMQWLRRFRVSREADLASLAPPALLILRFDPDERSATKLRAANPDWEKDFANRPVRDTLTHKLVAPDKLS